MIISFLGIFPVCLIIHGTGHPVRWALLIPGAVLVAAIAAWARVPLRAGIGVTPDRILIWTAAGHTTAVPWAQVSGFEGGKGSSTRDSEGTVYVLTSGGERLHTAGYSAPRTAATELWQLLRALEDERLARMPGAVSTVPAWPPPPPTPGKSYAAPLLAGLGVILLSDRAAVCRVVPFRLWGSGGEPSGSKACGASVGLGKARTGTALAPGAESRRQSSRNPTAIKSARSRHAKRTSVELPCCS